MAFSATVAILVAGVLALVQGVVSIFAAVAAVRMDSDHAPPGMSKDSMRRAGVPRLYIPLLFGVLSVTFAETLKSTALGAALCVGMAIYFGLVAWSYHRSPEIRVAGPYIGTYLSLGACLLYLAAAIV